MTFTDFIAHKDLGQKTMLFLIDGLYGSENVNGAGAVLAKGIGAFMAYLPTMKCQWSSFREMENAPI